MQVSDNSMPLPFGVKKTDKAANGNGAAIWVPVATAIATAISAIGGFYSTKSANEPVVQDVQISKEQHRAFARELSDTRDSVKEIKADVREMRDGQRQIWQRMQQV